MNFWLKILASVSSTALATYCLVVAIRDLSIMHAILYAASALAMTFFATTADD